MQTSYTCAYVYTPVPVQAPFTTLPKHHGISGSLDSCTKLHAVLWKVLTQEQEGAMALGSNR